MNKKYIATFVLGLFAIVGWNVFLIHRDSKMFNAYDKACSSLPVGHPDCTFAKSVK